LLLRGSPRGLRQVRTEARITQADAANALGIPRSAVSALETGDRHLTAVELAKCSALYQRPTGWFLGHDPGPALPPAAPGRLIAPCPYRPGNMARIVKRQALTANHVPSRPGILT
jgi:transcriptional regulator with XRE-family HTH domain